MQTIGWGGGMRGLTIVSALPMSFLCCAVFMLCPVALM